MPKDSHSKQQFSSVGAPTSWDAASTDAEAGKVWIAGGSIGALDFPGPLDGNTALVKSTIFSTSSSVWSTLVAFTPTEIGEFRIWRGGNTSTVIARLQFRFAAHTAFVDQPLAANGGAMNENQIGGYERGAAGEDLQVRVDTTAVSVFGGVKFQRIT